MVNRCHSEVVKPPPPSSCMKEMIGGENCTICWNIRPEKGKNGAILDSV